MGPFFDVQEHEIDAWTRAASSGMRLLPAIPLRAYLSTDLHVVSICSYDVEGHVTGFGNPTWAKTHGPATSTAPAIAALTAAGGASKTFQLCASLRPARCRTWCERAQV